MKYTCRNCGETAGLAYFEMSVINEEYECPCCQSELPPLNEADLKLYKEYEIYFTNS